MYWCSKFRVNTTITLGQKCNSSLSFATSSVMEAAANYRKAERCGSFSLKSAGLW